MKQETGFFGNLMGCSLILLLVAAPDAVTAYRNRTCTDFRTVARIGGCDWSGSCSVVFADGRTGELSKPYEGQPVCLETRWQWRKP